MSKRADIETQPQSPDSGPSGPSAQPEARTFASTVASFFRKNGRAEVPRLVIAKVVPPASRTALGFDLQVAKIESHLCRGSAGTYSVLQPELAYPQRDRKLSRLNQLMPAAIVSANINFFTHLESGNELPIARGVETSDEAIDEAGSTETFIPQTAWDIVASRTSWVLP